MYISSEVNESTEETAPETETLPEPSSESPAEPPLGLVKENGKWYYYAEPGVRFRGWLQTSRGYSYFDDHRVSGLYEIDGDTYYFPNGIMATGRHAVRGRKLFFDEVSGKLVADGWEKIQADAATETAQLPEEMATEAPTEPSTEASTEESESSTE